jgi:hypothetical protein
MSLVVACVMGLLHYLLIEKLVYDHHNNCIIRVVPAALPSYHTVQRFLIIDTNEVEEDNVASPASVDRNIDSMLKFSKRYLFAQHM